MRSRTLNEKQHKEKTTRPSLIQAGLRSVNDHHRYHFKRFGFETIGAKLQLDLTTPVYLSMNIDALDQPTHPAFRTGSLTVYPRVK